MTWEAFVTLLLSGGVAAASVRLVNGTAPCSGRVEVYHDDSWGTVCDDEWGLSDAHVVCRQLGCGVATSAPQRAHFGRGSGQIVLDNVQCVGSEFTLASCVHGGLGTHNCHHGEDAGVVCGEQIRKTVVRLWVTSEPSVNWRDSGVQKAILEQVEHTLWRQFLQSNSTGVKLSWRRQPNGEVFYMNGKTKENQGCDNETKSGILH